MIVEGSAVWIDDFDKKDFHGPKTMSGCMFE